MCVAVLSLDSRRFGRRTVYRNPGAVYHAFCFPSCIGHGGKRYITRIASLVLDSVGMGYTGATRSRDSPRRGPWRRFAPGLGLALGLRAGLDLRILELRDPPVRNVQQDILPKGGELRTLVHCGLAQLSVGYAAKWAYWLAVAVAGIMCLQLAVWTVSWVIARFMRCTDI